MKRKIAVFDFDGTLTSKDTMFDFIGFACGKFKLYLGLLIFAPMIAVMFMKIIDNNRCKQKLLSWYFKGLNHRDFEMLGIRYMSRVRCLLRADVLQLLNRHLKECADVYVVSASVKEWVEPICMDLGVKKVIATEMEVGSDGNLSGVFSTHNCFGPYKVKRFLEEEPAREEYYLYAYGDSRGDKEMFEFADEHLKV